MELYRVFAYDPAVRTGRPGHPFHVHEGQTAGRWDNAHAYATWYLSHSAAGAAGETFGNLGRWSPTMFETPFLPRARRALGVFEVDDDVPILDLDDARELVARHVRPSQVVIRNLTFTQPFALNVFRERDSMGNRRWAGIRWWSFQRPTWSNVAFWQTAQTPAPLRLLRVEPLSLDHPAIIDAAAALVREL